LISYISSIQLPTYTYRVDGSRQTLVWTSSKTLHTTSHMHILKFDEEAMTTAAEVSRMC
jgi:hypothetical protein